MAKEHVTESDPQIDRAIEELQSLVKRAYPDAGFSVAQGEDPDGTYLTATVDVEDSDAVVDVVIDRLIEMQVDEGLPVYFVPVRPIERVLEELDRPRRKLRARIEVEDGRMAL